MSHSLREGPALKIDFSWRKQQTLISDDKTDKPVLHVKYGYSKPQITFESALDQKAIGTALLHYTTLNIECDIRGQMLELKSHKLFRTNYTYSSKAFSSDTSMPTTMTWKGDCSLKTWTCNLLDEAQEPVARVTCNLYAAKKLGRIEFVGDKANDESAREEVVVGGLTLMYALAARSGTFAPFFAAHSFDRAKEVDLEATLDHQLGS